MNAIKSTFGLSVMCLMFAHAQAETIADQKICLENTADLYTETMVLHYAQPVDDHISFFGETCYQSLVAASFADCYPVHGSGTNFENKIELTIEGSEGDVDAAQKRFTTVTGHYSLSYRTLSGKWDSEKLVSYADGLEIQQFLSGSVKVVGCPVLTDTENAENKKFQRTIKLMDQK